MPQFIFLERNQKCRVFLPLLNTFSQEEQELLEQAVPETFDLGVGKRPYPLDSQNEEVV